MTPDEIGYTQAVNSIEKYKSLNGYKKGTPAQSKAAICYNRLLEKSDLQEEFEPIYEGEKIKMVYLKEPNLIKSPIITWKDEYPEKLFDQYEVRSKIDKEKMWEKDFFNGIERVFGAAKWEAKKKARLTML